MSPASTPPVPRRWTVLYWDEVDSPLPGAAGGTQKLLLAASEHGLARVLFVDGNHDELLQALAHECNQVVHDQVKLSEAARQLADYFAGERRTFSLPLDLPSEKGFRGTAQAKLREIGYGETRTYAEFASMLDRPAAVRAAASACATNPLPIVIPCHRVVRTDGGLGGYLGGEPAKRFLLQLESGQRA